MTEPNTQERILESIRTGELKMRPRSYFLVKSLFIVLGAVVLAGILLYFGSFSFYAACGGEACPAIHETGEILTFFLALPWLPILAAIVAALALEHVLNNFAPAYRWPVAYTFGLVIFLALVGSIGLHRIRLHERLESYVEDKEVPIFQPLYHHFGHSRTLRDKVRP